MEGVSWRGSRGRGQLEADVWRASPRGVPLGKVPWRGYARGCPVKVVKATESPGARLLQCGPRRGSPGVPL
jgi:hypothetical protein